MYTIRRSAIDSLYFEVLQETAVIREIAVAFTIRRIPSSFPTLEAVEEWLKNTEKKLAKMAAYRWLAMRSYPKSILFKKLREKQFSPFVCQELLDELERLGYLQDREFFERALEKEIARGYGPRMIEMKWRAQGFDPSLVRKEFTEKKQRAALKKQIVKMKGKERSKLIAFLLRRGFDSDLIRQELN